MSNWPNDNDRFGVSSTNGRMSKAFPAIERLAEPRDNAVLWGRYFDGIDGAADITKHKAGAARRELEDARELLAGLEKMAERWQKERAHTYASENADHYRGFDDGRLRSAQELEAAIRACQRDGQ